MTLEEHMARQLSGTFTRLTEHGVVVERPKPPRPPGAKRRKPINRTCWSKVALENLDEFMRLGFTYRDIASALGRSYEAIKSMAFKRKGGPTAAKSMGG